MSKWNELKRIAQEIVTPAYTGDKHHAERIAARAREEFSSLATPAAVLDLISDLERSVSQRNAFMRLDTRNKEWISELQRAPENSREARMVVIERDAGGVPTVWCDPEIADLVSALNSAGIRTAASCSGHAVRPGLISLHDGRELLITPDYETARLMEGYFQGINGEPPKHEAVAAEIETLKEGMRAIAFQLGAGGYNTRELTAEQLLEKVRWGIASQAESLERMIVSLRSERDQLRADVDSLKEASHV